MKRSTNVIVSNLSRDNILFSTFYTGLFLLFRKKNWGGTGPPGPYPCYGTALGYFELLKYFQRPGLSSEGATITELDTNKVTTMEGNTIAVLPHRYRITQGVLVSSKPCGWAKITKKYLFSIRIGYVDGSLIKNGAPRARPYLRNCRNPPIREILVIT